MDNGRYEYHRQRDYESVAEDGSEQVSVPQDEAEGNKNSPNPRNAIFLTPENNTNRPILQEKTSARKGSDLYDLDLPVLPNAGYIGKNVSSVAAPPITTNVVAVQPAQKTKPDANASTDTKVTI